MPYKILTDQIGAKTEASEKSEAFSPSDPLLLHIHLTPHQSLSPEGFVTFIGITFMLMLVPLSILIGTAIWWGIMPFILGALAFCWLMLKRSWRDGQLSEDLHLWSDQIRIHRCNPRGKDQVWEANPYWTKIKLSDGPVESYLTLEGSGREVELGRFLSPAERVELRDILARHL